MSRLSLTTRLIGAFLAVTVVCFGVIGCLLYHAAQRRIYAQDETNLVLSARHMRRFVGEMQSLPDLSGHKDRLIVGVLGDPHNALRVVDQHGQLLVDYNPSGYPLLVTPAVPTEKRIVASDLHTWRGKNGDDIFSVATKGVLKDGNTVTIIVARWMKDRTAILHEFRFDLLMALALGVLASAGLSYVLVRSALRPLRVMAKSASAITTRHLDSRIADDDAPVELRTLAAALNAMLARLEDGFANVWQFTVDLAHDLRTPIGNLRGANEVALTRIRSVSEYESLLGSNIEECDRVSRTIESVLFLARADNPRYALQRTHFDAYEELQHIADYFEGPSAEAAVTIQVKASGHLNADKVLFRRAVSNLLANALRYTPAGEVISVSATPCGEEIVVAVANPGPGISPEHVAKLFDRFYRVDPSRSDSASSTGLGLSIVKRIMELHQGRVSADSAPGDQTRFSLYFPEHFYP